MALLCLCSLSFDLKIVVKDTKHSFVRIMGCALSSLALVLCTEFLRLMFPCIFNHSIVFYDFHILKSNMMTKNARITCIQKHQYGDEAAIIPMKTKPPSYWPHNWSRSSPPWRHILLLGYASVNIEFDMIWPRWNPSNKNISLGESYLVLNQVKPFQSLIHDCLSQQRGIQRIQVGIVIKQERLQSFQICQMAKRKIMLRGAPELSLSLG